MANPTPRNQFVKGNKASAVRRKRFSENLISEKLEEYGTRMFDILANEALSARDSASRIRAADRFLCHTVIPPKNDDGQVHSII